MLRSISSLLIDTVMPKVSFEKQIASVIASVTIYYDAFNRAFINNRKEHKIISFLKKCNYAC